MRFLLGFDGIWFLDLLNGTYSEHDASPANALREFFPQLATFQSWQPAPLPETQENIALHLMAARDSRPLELRQHSEDLPTVAKMLRPYVDEWIGSGYSNGVESPTSRRLPARDSPLNRSLVQFLQTHSVQIWAESAGFIVAQFPKPPDASAEWIAYESARLMLAFIDSDLKHSIARCLKCGLYFERKRLQPYYKRGAYCEKHIRIAGVEGWRESRAALRLAAGVAAFQEWESLKRKAADEKKWLVERINKKLCRRDDSIKQRWVTENLAEIQQRAAAQTSPAPDIGQDAPARGARQ